MPSPPPVVRNLIVCEEVVVDPEDRKRVTLINVIDRLRSEKDPPYPFRPEKLSVYLRLTECRSSGAVRLEIQEADSNAVIFTTPNKTIPFPDNPLAVHWMSFRIRTCDFPAPGLYWVQFMYDNRPLLQQPLVLC